MKKRRRHFPVIMLLLALLISLSAPAATRELYQAATSYSNAKEFYESTALDGEPYHAEIINGTIYYATSAKLASSSTSLRYHTIGFDIEFSGNGHTVSFTVQRTGGSMVEINSYKDSTHEYLLYAIDDDTLFHLANVSDPATASSVLSASTIQVKMNAILTTKENGEPKGGITENGSGGFTPWGSIYRLKNSSDLSAIKRIFTGHGFTSYINIIEELDNHLLQIRYQVQGRNSTSSTTATVGNGYSITDGFLSQNGNIYIQKQRVLQQTNLLQPSNLHLQKEGYHLESGSEWITMDGRMFHSATSYMPQTIDSAVGAQDTDITLYANWKANTFTVNYDANGGSGSVLPTDFTYDQKQTLHENTFQRAGYTLKPGAEWNTKADGTGTSYSSSQRVSNLTSANGGTVTLYANWEPIVAKIHLDQQGGSGGTNDIYEKYGVGFYSNAACSTTLSTISLPGKTGYTCVGYYSSLLGTGKQIINNKGIVQVNPQYYINDETIYAHFTPNTYMITFDRQGGTLGTGSATATYDAYFPTANRPVKEGYAFQGYYVQPNGKGTQYYNENMACDDIYKFTKNLTLYAYWLDESAPTIALKTSADSWTNQKITLTVTASDIGSGLKSVQIYKVADDGNLTLVAQNNSCNGAATATLSYINPTEGIHRYKAVATDAAGNFAEAYNVVYYDVTPPKGELLSSSTSGTTLFFQIHITDVNIK